MRELLGWPAASMRYERRKGRGLMIKEVMDVEIRQEELLLASQRVHPSGRITYLALLWSRQLCILTVWSMARFYKRATEAKATRGMCCQS